MARHPHLLEILRERLSTVPRDWVQAVAIRAALRLLPYDVAINDSPKLSLIIFRACSVGWIGLNNPKLDGFAAAYSASNAAASDFDVPSVLNLQAMTYASAVATLARADPIGYAVEVLNQGDDLETFLFNSINADLEYLKSAPIDWAASQQLMQRQLWISESPIEWSERWENARTELLNRDPSYNIWIDWYERRIRGKAAAFSIPGDVDNVADESICTRIIEATAEEFWDKGANYVNKTLQGWIDEARSQATNLPPQDATATTYEVNAEGKIDRLPASDQQQLRDTSDQRQTYADLRETVEELSRFGQQLGDRLSRAVPRLLNSMPERFEEAEAYPIWRDGTRLRRIMLAHRIAAQSPDPDVAKLDPIVAVDAQGVLDLYNLLSLGDEALRSKDEATIPPQERVSANDEAAAAEPIISAILDTPDIATQTAIDDISSIVTDDQLPIDDPYADQVVIHNNKTARNWISAVISGAVKIVQRRPEKVGAAIAIGAATGVGGFAAKTGLGNVGAILDFVIIHAPMLKTYAAIAFSNFPIAQIIDDLIAIVRRQA